MVLLNWLFAEKGSEKKSNWLDHKWPKVVLIPGYVLINKSALFNAPAIVRL